MTIRHMEILKTIAETGSFTKAARVLYITQSAISHAVRELEEESGTVLFDRLSKSVRLTEAGSLLLRETLPVLAACNALEKRMRHLEQHAPIHLVSSITIATYYLPCALRSFSLTHPDISISVDVVSAANALLVLQAGEADFALIEGLPPQGPYVSIPFSSYPLKAVCSPGYRCSKQPLTLSALCQEKLLLREKEALSGMPLTAHSTCMALRPIQPGPASIHRLSSRLPKQGLALPYCRISLWKTPWIRANWPYWISRIWN